MENHNAEICEICGCMYVVGKPHICHKENSYVPKINLPRELAREISLKNTIALINSQEQRIKELAEENERLRAEVSVKKKLIDKCVDIEDQVRSDTVREMQHKIWLEFSDCTEEEKVSIVSFRASVDQIAKEMLEDTDGT